MSVTLWSSERGTGLVGVRGGLTEVRMLKLFSHLHMLCDFHCCLVTECMASEQAIKAKHVLVAILNLIYKYGQLSFLIFVTLKFCLS